MKIPHNSIKPFGYVGMPKIDEMLYEHLEMWHVNNVEEVIDEFVGDKENWIHENHRQLENILLDLAKSAGATGGKCLVKEYKDSNSRCYTFLIAFNVPDGTIAHIYDRDVWL